MHAAKGRKALHEPQGRAGCPQPAGCGAVRTPGPTSWRGFMVPMHAQMRKRAFHEPTNLERGLVSKAAEGRRTAPRRWRVGNSRRKLRQVLESAPVL